MTSPAPLTPLTEIEGRWQKLDAGPWTWRQCYETGTRVHWALESPESAAAGRVVSYLLVLRHCYPESFGEPVASDPYLHAIAHSRDDIEWLCEQVRSLEADRAAAAQREQALRQQVAELLDMLERRQRCEECGGSGAVSFWHHDEDGGYDSLEPCECWSDAEDLIAKYEQAKGANDDD